MDATETINELQGAKNAINMFTEALKAFTKIEQEKTEILKEIAANVAALTGTESNAKAEKESVPKMKKRLHWSIYYAYAGETDVYEAKTMKEFAELHDIPFTLGWLNPTHRLILDEKKRLIAEAELAMRLLEERGKRLAMFGYYLSSDYPPVPHCVIFRTRAEPQIDSWCKEYAEIVDYFDEAAGENTWHTDPEAANGKPPAVTPAPEPVGNAVSDMMDEIRQTCAKCVHRQKETKNTLISCSRHFYTIPQYHTKSHEKKYLANVKKKGEIDFPNCFKPEGGESCRVEK